MYVLVRSGGRERKPPLDWLLGINLGFGRPRSGGKSQISNVHRSVVGGCHGMYVCKCVGNSVAVL